MVLKKSRVKTFIALGIIASVIAVVFPMAAHFANKVPDPVYIKTEDDFNKINNNLSGYYILNGAVKFTKPVIPIGDKDHPFTGRFDCASELSGFAVNNVVIDLNTLDLDKYTVDNKTYIGLFAFNEGTIIHTVFNDIKFENFNYTGNNDLYIGGLTGLNKGKITSNRIFELKNLSFKSQNNITFGGCAGLNLGEIRRNSYTKHFECHVSCDQFSIGEFAGECSKNSIVEMCSVGPNIHINNYSESNINQLNVGLICGTLSGGTIQNNIFKSTINVMNNKISKTNCGGVVGLVTGYEKSLIKDCYFNGTVDSNGNDVQRNSYVVGNISCNSLYCENLLIGGTLTSHNLLCENTIFSDVGPKIIDSVTNCYLLDNSLFPSECIRNVQNVINIKDVTLSKMKWSDAIWGISDGKITFKA